MKNKTLSLLLLLCLCCSAQPAHAQFKNWAKSFLRKQTSANQLKRAPGALSGPLESAAAEQALRSGAAAAPKEAAEARIKMDPLLRQAALAARQNRLQKMQQEFDRHAQLSVFLARQIRKRPGETPLAATGFVFETHYNGKREIWGLTARHVADKLGDEFNAVFYRDGKEIVFRAEVVQRGTNESADIVLLRLPPQAAAVVRPLKLTRARADEPAVSYGYVNNQFKKVPGRHILHVSPLQLRAALPVPAAECTGLCGGPLLTAERKAAGIYCGHSYTHAVGYAVNTAVVQDLLRAVRNRGIATRTMKINGVSVGEINIDEAVSRVTAYRGMYVTDYYVVHRSQGDIDYAHLEKLVRLEGADRVEISFSRGASVNQSSDEHAKQIFLTLDLKTNRVSRLEYYGPLMQD